MSNQPARESKPQPDNKSNNDGDGDGEKTLIPDNEPTVVPQTDQASGGGSIGNNNNCRQPELPMTLGMALKQQSLHHSMLPRLVTRLLKAVRLTQVVFDCLRNLHQTSQQKMRSAQSVRELVNTKCLTN